LFGFAGDLRSVPFGFIFGRFFQLLFSQSHSLQFMLQNKINLIKNNDEIK
jgi:hypothetical protein